MRKTIIVLGGAILLGWILLGAGCSFDEPVNPRWDMQVVIPLSEQRYSLEDLVDTTMEAGVILSGDSLLSFFYQDSIPQILFGDSIYLPPQQDSINSGLKELRVDVGLDQDLNFSLGDIDPSISSFQGQTVPVPSFNFTPVTKNLDSLENLEYADIDSGYLYYQVTNHLPITVQNVEFRVFHTHNTNYTVVQETINSLDSGETTTGVIDLHGRRIVSELSNKLLGSSPGSATPVYIDTSQSISVLTQVGIVKVSEARAKIPVQTVMLDSMYALESQHYIREAGIQHGTLHLRNYNETEISATLHIHLLDFISPLGDTLEIEAPLAPQTVQDSYVSLDGYTIRIANPANQTLHITAEAFMDSTQEFVNFQVGQNIFSTFETDTVYLDYIDGVLAPVTVTIGPEVKEVAQLPEGWEQLNFIGATLSIRLDSDISTPITTNIHLVAWREGIPRDSVLIQEIIVPNQDSVFVINGLERLLAVRPDTVVYYGTAGVSGDIRIEASNHVEGVVRVNIPICFTAAPININGNIQATNRAIDSDKKVKGATVETTIHNHLPLSGSVVVLVTHDSTLFRTNPFILDTLVSFTIDQPTISGGRVVGEVESQIDIALTDELIEWFRTVPVYTRPIFHLDGTQGDTLSAYGSDYLGFSAIGRFIYEVDTE